MSRRTRNYFAPFASLAIFATILDAGQAKPMATHIGSSFDLERPLSNKNANQIAAELEGKQTRELIRRKFGLDSRVLRTLTVAAKLSVQDGIGSYTINVKIDASNNDTIDHIGMLLESYCKLRIAGVQPDEAWIRAGR